jgi:ribosome-associated protein
LASGKASSGQEDVDDGGAGSGTSGERKAKELALAIASAALDLKALNVEIIDVRGKVDYSDYVVVMSGRSDRQVNALASNIEQAMERKKVRCIGIEGMPHGNWLLMDYGDVIVHIFHQDTRGYYDLESLWLDAARVSVE